MKHNIFSKKWLIVIVVIVVGIFAWGLDAGNSFTIATKIEPNSTAQTYTINSNEPTFSVPPINKDKDYFKIVLTTAGTLILESTDTSSLLYAELYDSSTKNIVASDTLSLITYPLALLSLKPKKNFSISQYLPAGTYYLKVGTYVSPLNVLTGSTKSTTYKFGSKFEPFVGYNPKWYQFNIERLNAKVGDYALYTQVTGTDYYLQVASYKKDVKGNYTTRSNYSGALEVELFEIPASQTNFDTICKDSSNAKAWSNNQKHFYQFNNTQVARVEFTKDDNKYAMRNAGVRAWVLMADYNNDKKLEEIAKNNKCVNTNGKCFRDLYAKDLYYPKDKKCAIDCRSGSTDEKCYQCLKKNYAQPICSRDNFAIRPYGIELEATTGLTKKTSIQKNDTVPKVIPNLISGLDGDYQVKVTAKSANNKANPTGYAFRRLLGDDIPNNKFDEIREFFGLKFDNSKINNRNKDITKCGDSTHKRFDGAGASWKLENNNVGNYDVILVDKDWTMVDQKEYKDKVSASKGKDDCIPKSTELYNTTKKQSGCDLQSFEVNNKDTKYNKIPIKFVPAKISLQKINKPIRNWSYINTLTAGNLDMGAKFLGTIEAQNAKNTPTTNFTAGCFAQDVDLNLSYSSGGLDNNGKAIKAKKVGLQYAQAFNSETHTIKTNPLVTQAIPLIKTDTKTTDKELNLRTRDIIIGLKKGAITPALSKDKFSDNNKGSIVYDLRISINKLLSTAIDPIEILFLDLKSKLYNNDGMPTEVYKAGAKVNIVDNKNYYKNDPTKSKIIQQKDRDANSYAFVYGSIHSTLMTKVAQQVKETTKKTDFSAVGYCVANCDKYKASNTNSPYKIFGQTTVSNWYRMDAHNKDTDGMINKLHSDNNLAKMKLPNQSYVKELNNVKFKNNKTHGQTEEVILSYPMTPRAKTVTYTIDTAPWLMHKIAKIGTNNNPTFQINWVSNGSSQFIWAGKGEVGSMTKITPPPKTNRLSW